MATQSSDFPPTYVEGWNERESVGRLSFRRLGQTNMKVPLIALGAAHVSQQCKVITESDGSISVTGAEEPIAAIREAVRLGVNFIDTSPFYGQGVSELIVGQALCTIPRQAYYIATKAGRNPDCTFDFTSDSIRQSVERSLKKLGVEYIDLIQIHDVEFGSIETILKESLPTLAQLRDQNKVRYIGITGYSLKVLKEIVERSEVKIDTILSYCRHTLFDNELVNYLPFFEVFTNWLISAFTTLCPQSRHIGIINASVFGMGLYGLHQPIPYWHPAPNEIKQSCQQAARLSQSLGVHINRLALQHSIRESRIHTHLIGMESPEMARLNVQTVTEESTQSEQQIVDRILSEVFAKLTVHNWEDTEVLRYHRNPEAFANFLRRNPAESNSN